MCACGKSEIKLKLCFICHFKRYYHLLVLVCWFRVSPLLGAYALSLFSFIIHMQNSDWWYCVSVLSTKRTRPNPTHGLKLGICSSPFQLLLCLTWWETAIVIIINDMFLIIKPYSTHIVRFQYKYFLCAHSALSFDSSQRCASPTQQFIT